MRYAYPAEVLEEADGVTVTCPDVPEMVTGGWGDVAANLDAAGDALETALSGYVEDGRPIPVPSPPDGRPVVVVGPLAAAKFALHEAMLEKSSATSNSPIASAWTRRRCGACATRSTAATSAPSRWRCARSAAAWWWRCWDRLTSAPRLASAPAPRHLRPMATITAAATIDITVNGEARELPAPITVAELLARIGLDTRKVAVERNMEIVPRSTYAGTALAAGDALEIVHFIGGG